MSAAVVSGDVEIDRRSGSLGLQLGAVLTVVGSVAYVSMNGMTPREAFLHPVGLVGNVIATVGCLMLAFALVQWRTSLPRWAVLSSAWGVAIAGAAAWSYTTAVAAVATASTDSEFEDLFINDWWLFGLGLGPKSVLCAVGFIAIAIAGWRARSIPRSAAVLFGLGGVLSLWPPFPPGLILASIALLLVARRAKTG